MSFVEYPEYKGSGVQWLGEVPSNWKIGRLKHLLRIRGGQDYKSVESYVPTDFPVIGSGGQFTYATDYLYDGESVLLGRKGTIDKPLYVKGKFWTVDTMFYTEVLPGTNGRYAYYLATTIPFDLYSTNTALPSMSQFDLANHGLPLPPKCEQTQIARFLDHETAKIDALIREQERLIELLQEKRQAVISHAVTKGLDPDVPMKDSGVEWLGEVPAHWDRTLIKHCCYINDGNHGEEYPKGDDFVDDADIGVPFIRGGNLKDMTVTTEGMLYITAEKNRSMRKGRLQVGDILFVNRGEIGKLAVIPSSMNGANLNSQIAYLRVENRIIDPHYLVHYLASDTIKAEIKAAQEGSVLTQYPISDLAAIHVPVPPKDEQQKISTYLKEQLFSFNVLTSEASNSINLLSERRSALISAAVTGKIDVRNWQPPSDESAFDEEVRQAGMEATA